MQHELYMVLTLQDRAGSSEGADYSHTIVCVCVSECVCVCVYVCVCVAIEVGRHRQAWLPKGNRLCPHCDQGTVETELHYLTQCTQYEDIRSNYSVPHPPTPRAHLHTHTHTRH